MLCLAQYSRRVIPLSAKPVTMFRISCLLRIPPFSAASLSQIKMGSSDDYNELHVPVSDSAHPTSTFLTLLSADTDFSFWVPRLGGKTDLSSESS